MGESSSTVQDRWGLRSVPDDLARRYLAEGWWTDATLGGMVADGLGGKGRTGFEVHSQVRPWKGTLRRCRPGGPCAGRCPAGQGRGPGRRRRRPAARTGWRPASPSGPSAYLGAVVVPIVHFYGPKEVEYIVRVTSPRGGGDRRPVRAQRLPGHLLRAAGAADRAAVAGGRRHARPGPARRGPRRSRRCSTTSPSPARSAVDPDSPAIIGFTSGTTRDPKGVVHSHRTIGCETRQLDCLFPRGGPPQITGRRWATSSGCSMRS